MEWYQFACSDKERRQFGFSSRGHDKLDDLGDGQDRPVESWDWIIFREEDIAPAQLHNFDSLRKLALE